MSTSNINITINIKLKYLENLNFIIKLNLNYIEMASYGLDPNAPRNPANPYDFSGVQVLFIIFIIKFSKNHLLRHIREIKLGLELK